MTHDSRSISESTSPDPSLLAVEPIEVVVPGIERCIALWAYRGAAADLVRGLKYGRSTASVTELADSLAAVAPAADFVTWIPATPGRRRRRGFDQSELLARAVARRLSLPAAKTLRRLDGIAQTSRDLEGRREGPMLAYSCSKRHRGANALVIDDVFTTGSTLAAASRTLRAGGHRRVVAAVVAKVGTKGAIQTPPGRTTLKDTQSTEVKRGNLHQ